MDGYSRVSNKKQRIDKGSTFTLDCINKCYIVFIFPIDVLNYFGSRKKGME